MGTILVSIVLLIFFSLAILKLYRDSRKGGCNGCSGCKDKESNCPSKTSENINL